MKKWVSTQANLDPALIAEIRQREKISPLVSELVLRRLEGRVDLVGAYLRPELKNLNPPDSFPDIKVAVDRLILAIVRRETIFIHGDYDVDGICACALLTHFLRRLGAESIIPFVPERQNDGYGVSMKAIDRAKAMGAGLFITADCGVTAIGEIAHARTLGLDVIVTDHHLPKETLPAAVAVVNPNRSDSQAKFKGLCGTGVAFFVCLALRAGLRAQGLMRVEFDVREYLDLVALATLADVVPLIEDNRVLVAKGLGILAQTTRPGLQALMRVSGLEGKKISAQDVAFRIIPRLNACGRIGEAKDGLELLLTEDTTRALELAQKLQNLNETRKSMVSEIVAQNQQAGPLGKALVLASADWHPGVIGVVAAKLVDAYQKPTAVISFQNGQGVGSLRSVFGLDLLPALEASAEHLVRFGGHPSACGVGILPEKLDAFRKSFVGFFDKVPDEIFQPKIVFDTTIDLALVKADLLEELLLLEPFGEKNPEPLFAASNVQMLEPRRVGGKHLKLRCREGKSNPVDAIFFNFDREDPDQNSGFDVLFHPRWNEFNGRKTIQLEVKDLRISR